MRALYFVCFGVGAGFTIISFLVGELGNLINFDADFDPGIDGNASISPFKPTVLAAFLTVFGGVGLLLKNMSPLNVLVISTFIGILVAFIFLKCIIAPLYRAQNTSSVDKQSLIGLEATVSELIPQGQYGKITYYVNGNTYSAPAKSENGQQISRMQKVEIVYIEKNTFYVKPKI